MTANRNSIDNIDRRTFLGVSGSCAAHLAMMTYGAPESLKHLLSSHPTPNPRLQEPWGRLEQVADGAWALISTPLEDRTTLCNGGIIAGQDGAVVVESFASPDGARWMAEKTRELAGRWPTHVVMTHFHGDHTGGIEGFERAEGQPEIMTTEETRELTRGSDTDRGREVSAVRSQMMADISILGVTRPKRIDLGGRVVHIIPREGHTPSDVTVELEDPSIVWCGDLVWNQMFPNYRDTIPTLFAGSVRSLSRERETTYVPGHGPLANQADLDRYIQLIDDVGAAANRALEAGTPITDAAAEYSIPESLGEWFLFNPRYFEVAFSAWEREKRM